MDALPGWTADPANNLAGFILDGQDDLGLIFSFLPAEFIPTREGYGLAGLVERFFFVAPGFGSAF